MRADLAVLLRLQADLATTARDQASIAAQVIEQIADLDDAIAECSVYKAESIIGLFRDSERQLCRAAELLHSVARHLEQMIEKDMDLHTLQHRIRDDFASMAEEQAWYRSNNGSRERPNE